MHEMQTVVTDVHGVCLCGGHSVQPLPNYFGHVLLTYYKICPCNLQHIVYSQ